MQAMNKHVNKELVNMTCEHLKLFISKLNKPQIAYKIKLERRNTTNKFSANFKKVIVFYYLKR